MKNKTYGLMDETVIGSILQLLIISHIQQDTYTYVIVSVMTSQAVQLNSTDCSSIDLSINPGI